MKKILLLVIAAFAMILTSACDKREIHNTLEEFFTALQEQDFEKASTYLSDDFEVQADGVRANKAFFSAVETLTSNKDLTDDEFFALMKIGIEAQGRKLSTSDEIQLKAFIRGLSSEERAAMHSEMRKGVKSSFAYSESDVKDEMKAIKDGTCEIDDDRAIVTYTDNKGKKAKITLVKKKKWLIRKMEQK